MHNKLDEKIISEIIYKRDKEAFDKLTEISKKEIIPIKKPKLYKDKQ